MPMQASTAQEGRLNDEHRDPHQKERAVDVNNSGHREDPARGSDEEAETETSYGEHESSSRRTRKEASFGRELH